MNLLSIICPVKSDDFQLFTALNSISNFIPHELKANIIIVYSECSDSFLCDVDKFIDSSHLDFIKINTPLKEFMLPSILDFLTHINLIYFLPWC